MTTREIQKARAGALARYYLAAGAPEYLGDAILVCRYAEAVLAGLPATETARLEPVFDMPMEELRDAWKSWKQDPLWIDTETGNPTAHPVGLDDCGEVEGRFNLWPLADQEALLFGRWAHLFR